MAPELLIAAAMFVLGSGITAGGFIVAGSSAPATAIHCPTEDSCSVSYYGGAWHIAPTVP